MATSRVTVDTDIITLRQIYVRDALNGLIPNEHILISDGAGVGYWNSISSIYEISSFRQVRGNNGYTFHANQFNNILNVSTTGVNGLLDCYVDPATSTLMFSNAYPQMQIATIPVPSVTSNAATVMPGAETLVAATGQSTFKFLGVGDILLSTVTNQNATFISISSFTSKGYADLSAEAYAWRPYLSSLNSSILLGYKSYTSSIPAVGPTWNWSSNVYTTGLPFSTVDADNLYATGDVYFSTISFTLSNFQSSITSDSTTRLALEVHPSYFFDRLYLGTDADANLVKPISTFIQYQTTRGPEIVPSSFNYDYIVTQQSNNYTSNAFNTSLRLPIDSGFVLEKMAQDGPGGYYTLYHYMPGAMARFVSDGCDRVIDGRGGFSNTAFDNRSSRDNAVFLHVQN